MKRQAFGEQRDIRWMIQDLSTFDPDKNPTIKDCEEFMMMSHHIIDLRDEAMLYWVNYTRHYKYGTFVSMRSFKEDET